MKNHKDTISGRKPIEEAINNQETLSKIFIQKGVTGPFEKLCRHYCRENQVPLSVVPKERLNRMVKGNHQGVVAWISPIDFVDLGQLVMNSFEQEEYPLFLLLDGVMDTRNIGAIARSALVFGVNGIILSIKNSAPINGITVKSSAGAIMKIPVSRAKSMASCIEFLRQSGFHIIASDLDATSYLHEMDVQRPLGVVMGSEDTGISQEVQEAADELYLIPQNQKLDSLNVSVATGISLYEIFKSRKIFLPN